MDLFISTALAQSGESAGGGILSLVPLVLIFVLFYFLLFRPQQKRNKKHKELVAGLQLGDEVATNGGIIGRISDLDENYIELEVSPSTYIQVQRFMVAQMMPEGSYRQDSTVNKKSAKAKKSKKKSNSE